MEGLFQQPVRHGATQAPHEPLGTGIETHRWLAVALVRDVRLAARWVFQDLM